jgi:hypothetical protein
MSINQHEGREGAVYGRALAKLLVGKGVLGRAELEASAARSREAVGAEAVVDG